MANNYRLFSEAITDLTHGEMKWLGKVLVYTHSDDWEDKCPQVPELLGLEDREDYPGCWPDFEISVDKKAGELQLYAEESGNVENAALLIHRFLKLFRPGDVFHLHWADTCSRPLVGQFGGGVAIITADGIIYLHSWMDETQLDRFALTWLRKRLMLPCPRCQGKTTVSWYNAAGESGEDPCPRCGITIGTIKADELLQPIEG